MQALLRNLSIGQRLYFNLFISAIAMLILVWIVLGRYHNALMDEKKIQVRHEVETAFSLLEYYSTRSKKGEFDKVKAQDMAMNAVKSLRYERTDYFWINDMAPNMVMHPIKAKLDGKYLGEVKDPNGKKLFIAFVDEVKRGGGAGFVDYLWPKPGSEDPVKKLSYVKHFKDWDWIIGSGIYVDDVEAQYQEMVQRTAIVFVILLVALAGLSTIIIRSITLPLQEANAAMDDIAKGEGDLTCSLNESGKDEVSHLASGFNLFVAKIATVIKEIQPVSREVSQASESLGSIVNENARIAQQQHEETDGVATAMNEMLSTTQEVANSAQQAAMAAGDANEKATTGQSTVGDTITSIGELASELENTVGLVNKLEQDTQQIGSVLDVIRGVAEQTNLLALNAAIEAARAGEQGRGFAVVADEVRTLATRTQASTDEIQQMIEQLQQGANRVVQSMEHTQGQSSATAEQAQAAGDSLNGIVEAINVITDMNHQIASAAEQQSKAADEINRNVTNISELAVETVSHNEQTSQASESLQQVGGQLEGLIGQFKA